MPSKPISHFKPISGPIEAHFGLNLSLVAFPIGQSWNIIMTQIKYFELDTTADCIINFMQVISTEIEFKQFFHWCEIASYSLQIVAFQRNFFQIRQTKKTFWQFFYVILFQINFLSIISKKSFFQKTKKSNLQDFGQGSMDQSASPHISTGPTNSVEILRSLDSSWYIKLYLLQFLCKCIYSNLMRQFSFVRLKPKSCGQKPKCNWNIFQFLGSFENAN